MIDIGWLTKAGSHWLVTSRGCQVLMNLMKEMGVLTMEHLLVQQLPESKCILKDGVPKYMVIDGNHCVMTAQQLFPNKSFKWCCKIVDVCIPYHFDVFLGQRVTHHSYLQESVSEDDIAILVWGCNHMHNKAAVHKDEWEEFFQHFHRLQQGNFWKSNGRAVDWDRYITTLVQPTPINVVHTHTHQNSSVYTYTLLHQLHYD
jgi:hypothetical protein